MLPEQRIAASGRVEERQSEGALGLEQHGAQDQRRKRYEHHQGRDQDVPAEDRHSVERHARSRILRTETIISTASESADISTKVTPSSQTSALTPRRVDVRAQRRVHEPAAVGRDPGDQRGWRVSSRRTGSTSSRRRSAAGTREVPRAEHLGSEIDRDALQHGMAKRKSIIEPCMVKTWL